MIVHISQGMEKLALGIIDTKTGNRLIDWRRLELIIEPGQADVGGCGPNGSPWILTGCWPGKRTGVDVANWRPDFPPLAYPAFMQDDDGRILFLLDERLWRLPPGRYTGLVMEKRREPFDPAVLKDDEPVKRPTIPPAFLIGTISCSPEDKPAPPPPPPPSRPCVLARFDIDLGPACSDHMIDSVAVDFPRPCCGAE